MSVATSAPPPAIGSSDPAARARESTNRTRPSLRPYLSRLVSTASRASSGSLRSATTHPASEIVDFRGGCSRTAHTAHDCTLPLTLRGGSTPTWRTGRHQARRGWCRSVETSSEAMTAARTCMTTTATFVRRWARPGVALAESIVPTRFSSPGSGEAIQTNPSREIRDLSPRVATSGRTLTLVYSRDLTGRCTCVKISLPHTPKPQHFKRTASGFRRSPKNAYP